VGAGPLLPGGRSRQAGSNGGLATFSAGPIRKKNKENMLHLSARESSRPAALPASKEMSADTAGLYSVTVKVKAEMGQKFYSWYLYVPIIRLKQTE
jgi:hypothetical protein